MVGATIGAVALAIPLVIFLIAQPGNDSPQDINETRATFTLNGYLKEVSEDTLTISQSRRGDWLENDEVRAIDLHIDLTQGAVIDNCYPTSSHSIEECVENFRNGIVPQGTSVCAVVRLIDNELYGARIHFGMMCDLPPRIPTS